jgi:type I restriction enzyme, S subunit
MKSYSSYKDSTLKWIGDIPSHWDIVKLKFIGDVIIGLSYKPENVVEEGEGNLVMRSSNVQNGKPSFADNVYVDCEISDKLTTKEGDILICSRNGSRNLIGKNCVITKDIEGMTFGVFMTIFRSDFWHFVYWTLNSPIFTSQSSLFLTATINQLTVSTLQNFVIPFTTDKDEQKLIASYLESKTQKIDKLIELTEQNIELLKEQRTALINQCVTKGLNPNVEMKDSGVEWIGEIPCKWKFLNLWLIVKNAQLGGNYISGNDAQLYPIIKMGNIGRGKIVLDKVEYLGDKENFDTSHFLMDGDFLFNTRNSRDLVGKVTLWRDELESSLYNSNILRVKFDSAINDAYMSYLFNTKSFLDILRLISKGTTNVSAIYYKDLSKLKVCIPPTDEQIQIVTLLDSKTQKIDSAIEKESERIEFLKEYRQALISEVVTGKIDVRDEVV